MTQVGKLALVVAVFSVLLFAVVIGNGFVLDDAPLISENPFLRSLGNIPRFFTSDYWEPRTHGGLYRPLVTTTYALNHAVGSLDPRGYRVGVLGREIEIPCSDQLAIGRRLSGRYGRSRRSLRGHASQCLTGHLLK